MKICDEYVNSKEAKSLLQVSIGTLRNWDASGKIRTIRTPSGIRRYNMEDIHNILDCKKLPEEKPKVCYARVSSKKQMDDLKRQEDLFRSQFPNHQLVTDIGSGINWNRKGLHSILELAMQRKLGEVVVAHRDRLARFAFDLIKWILIKNKVNLVVLDDEDGKSTEQELAEDIISIIHVYSCKSMGKRRYKMHQNPNIPDSKEETYSD